MRVGILTYHFSDNYGALMQAYGLRQWLLSQGVDAEFINYHPAHVEGGSVHFDRGLKALAKSAYLLATQTTRHWLGNKGQAEAFGRFYVEELGVRSPRITDAEGLGALAPFDLIVCGSDQIWNPSEQHGLDPVYFGAFPLAQKGRRISYAASFGKSSLAAPYHAEASKLIRGLDAIAVRERSGVEIVRELTGREAVLTPDPTILLGDFSALIERCPTPQRGHVFCYALRTADGVREAAQIAADCTGGTILSPANPHRRWRQIGTTVYPSPGEWLTLLDQASVVVTNSFHGVALSVLRNKPFVSIALPGARAALSERARNLLGQLGLEDRLVPAGDSAAVKAALDREINWTETSARLKKMGAMGRDYLASQISASQNTSDVISTKK